MLFHGKALEIYTAAYQNIQNIDENEDLEVRVIKICFSVYFLYKKQFSQLGYTSNAENCNKYFRFAEKPHVCQAFF